jgi:hypothetical protein
MAAAGSALGAGYEQTELIGELEALPATRGRDALLARVRAREFCLATGTSMPNVILAVELERLNQPEMAKRAAENYYTKHCASARAYYDELYRAAYAQMVAAPGAAEPVVRVITREKLASISAMPARELDILSEEGQTFLESLVDPRAVDAYTASGGVERPQA